MSRLAFVTETEHNSLMVLARSGWVVLHRPNSGVGLTGTCTCEQECAGAYNMCKTCTFQCRISMVPGFWFQACMCGGGALCQMWVSDWMWSFPTGEEVSHVSDQAACWILHTLPIFAAVYMGGDPRTYYGTYVFPWKHGMWNENWNCAFWKWKSRM